MHLRSLKNEIFGNFFANTQGLFFAVNFLFKNTYIIEFFIQNFQSIILKNTRVTSILAKSVFFFAGEHDFSKLDHLKSKIQKDFVSICSNLVLERLIFCLIKFLFLITKK